MRTAFGTLVLTCAVITTTVGHVVSLNAGVLEYGTENLLGTGTYSSDPKAGATLVGLAPGVVTDASASFGHGYPFTPGPGDYQGTDQIYVGSTQAGADDGYSISGDQINGPQVITMNYSSLIPVGQQVQTLTLGIASDDFQFPTYGNPYFATINGNSDASLTTELNSLLDNGPQEHFFTIGIDPSLLSSSGVLTLSIDQGGNGGDGWAIDFLTIGVTTTSSVPEPSSFALIGLGGLGLAISAGLRRMAAV